MGIAREQSGPPVQYERNQAYLSWRRVEQIRQEYSEREIVERLKETLTAIEKYREQFDAISPDEVSLMDEDYQAQIEEIWIVLSDWKTLEEQAALLDTACQHHR